MYVFSKIVSNFWWLDIMSIHKIHLISFEYVDFWQKIYLILWPSLENLTTYIAIMKGTGQGCTAVTRVL